MGHGVPAPLLQGVAHPSIPTLRASTSLQLRPAWLGLRYLYLSKHRVALSERARRWPPPGSNLVVGAEGRLSTSSALAVTLLQHLLVLSGACYEHQQSASKSNARAWDWVVAQWISLKTTIREPLRARLWSPGNPHAVTMLWMDYDYITASALPHLSCLADC